MSGGTSQDRISVGRAPKLLFGLSAAIEAAAQGVSVGLVCKSLLDAMSGSKMLNNWLAEHRDDHRRP